ncbi:hypothetical protein PN498_10815 [Oscillatoria sp. CS-180]|uniref:hypothetical protein n=1 Tax=Oscillatoria sp. CS-180 TaxID=3021720 RepID=UPI00233004A6|nr:hypothetical protein [Oscillatoria sp. CS-180]MDB9526481.1 hypothetical protein [Oscillatoria sp. CS-180]
MNDESKQLELALDLALDDPAEADLSELWQQFEVASAQLSTQERLRLGSQAIECLARIYRAKANWLLDDWEYAYDPQDPNLPGDWLQGLVRQTQQVDLSDLTAPAQRRSRTNTSKKHRPGQDTVVGEVSKANLLEMLDQVELETRKTAALAVAHEERVQEWVSEIQAWFEQYPQPIPLLDLQQNLGWPLIQLWLSLLLGGFQLETTEPSFYSSRILVSPGANS